MTKSNEGYIVLFNRTYHTDNETKRSLWLIPYFTFPQWSRSLR